MNNHIDEIIDFIKQHQKPAAIIGLLVFTVLVTLLLIINKPDARKQPAPDKIVSVEVLQAKKQTYPVIVSAGGSVQAVTRSHLVAQVRGEITFVSDKFKNGGLFRKGDTLLRIDNKEYIASASQAEAAYLQAQSNYSQELVNAEQASKDWQRLGFEGEPNDLVLRKPQLQAATAQLASSKASYESAKLDLQRTRISAPYNGYTIQKQVDIGQYVTIGTVLGEVYADKGIEVSLPLTQNSYAQLDLAQKPAVKLYATLAGLTHTWPAQITRADSIFDPTTRQLNVVAKVKNTRSNHGLELKIGQYVSASIIGHVAENVFVVPNNSIREGSYMFLLKDGRLKKHTISIVWQDEENSIINNLQENDQIVLTSLGGAVNGMKAKIVNPSADTSQSLQP